MCRAPHSHCFSPLLTGGPAIASTSQMEQPRTLEGLPCCGADRRWTSPRVADSRDSARFLCVRESFLVCSARSWEPGEVVRFSAARRFQPGSFVPRWGVAPASRRSPHAAGERPAPLSSDRAPLASPRCAPGALHTLPVRMEPSRGPGRPRPCTASSVLRAPSLLSLRPHSASLSRLFNSLASAVAKCILHFTPLT